MKLTSRAYWVIVFIGFMANFFIFLHMSKNLEEYEYFKSLDKFGVVDSEFANFNEQQ